ncbi:O-antigen ligase family protein [Prosthecobacter sp.]|uniref:O-antigen ligase family protein n=1 Tax=Prosthecobacter sp. TaxID=1965333 RepID=UPI001D5B1DF9|nr:O-antigen ligase family protein [Prosthecobacter sp.]MCB1275227.1 O-antigen ligase family protein [Prosthecobacter sp.]
MQKFALILFLLGLFVTGLLGTETRLLFFWPGCALIGLAGLIAVLRWKLRVSFQPSDWCLLSVAALAGYVGWRAWVSPVEVYAREDAAVLLTCFVAYLMTVTAASDPKWRLGIVCVLLVLVAGNLTAGWLNFKGRWDFHLVPGFSRSFPPGRIGGFFNNPNHLAAFLSFAAFLSTGVMLFARIHIASRLLLGFGILAMLAGMALTVSRAAMLGFAVGALVFLLLTLWIVWCTRRSLFKWLVIALLLVGGAVGGALYKVNEESMLTRQLATPLGEDMRVHIWRATLAQHADSPWIGVGSRMFYEGGITHRDPEASAQTGNALFAHNEYLQTMADYGWAGLTLVVLVMLTHLLNGLRFLRWFAAEKFPATGMLGSNSLALTIGSIAALLATLVHAVFEFHGHIPITAVLGAVLLGLLASPGIESEVFKPRRIWGLRFIMKIAMLAASAAMIAAAAVFGTADGYAALARVEGKRGETAKGLVHFERAVEIDPRNAILAYQHGLALMDSIKSNMTKDAYLRTVDACVRELTRATALNPDNYLYQLALADALDAAGKHDDAMAAIQRALTLAPLYEEPRLALGMHYHRLKDFEQAEFAYLWAGQAKALNPEGTTNWLDNYRELLRQTALMAEQERAARIQQQGR